MDTMTETTALDQARAAVEALAGATADLLRSLPSTDTPIPGSEWTVRDAAAHLVDGAALYCDIANGVSSPIMAPIGDGAAFRDAIAVYTRQRLADIPETDPFRLATLVVDAAARLIETTGGRSDDQPVPFHCGMTLRLADLLGISVGEHVLHGYDIALATGRPWPIDPAHAALALGAYAPNFGLCVNRTTTRGINVAYEIELRGVGRSVARFVDGTYRLECADSGPVDCVISADPVAYLLLGTGRLHQCTAVALGLLSAGGSQPELAGRFSDLLVFP
jgi:uncharacterized protein (TIGR03083 family)